MLMAVHFVLFREAIVVRRVPLAGAFELLLGVNSDATSLRSGTVALLPPLLNHHLNFRTSHTFCGHAAVVLSIAQPCVELELVLAADGPEIGLGWVACFSMHLAASRFPLAEFARIAQILAVTLST